MNPIKKIKIQYWLLGFFLPFVLFALGFQFYSFFEKAYGLYSSYKIYASTIIVVIYAIIGAYLQKNKVPPEFREKKLTWFCYGLATTFFIIIFTFIVVPVVGLFFL